VPSLLEIAIQTEEDLVGEAISTEINTSAYGVFKIEGKPVNRMRISELKKYG
jgi:hypothetical protein